MRLRSSGTIPARWSPVVTDRARSPKPAAGTWPTKAKAAGKTLYSIRPDTKTLILPAPDVLTTNAVAAVSFIPPFKKFHCIC